MSSVLNEIFPASLETQRQPEITYRRAMTEDVPAMILLEDQANAVRLGKPIPDTLVRPRAIRQLAYLLDKPATWSRMAFEGDTFAGFIIGCPANDIGEDRTDCDHVVALMVHPDHWRKGIGGGLLDWAFDELRPKGVTKLNLWTQTDNPSSNPLYQGRGFQLTGRGRIHPEMHEAQVEYDIFL